jgi:hypothetical protein
MVMSNGCFIKGSSCSLGRAYRVALEAAQRVVARARQPEQFSDLRAIHKDRLLSAIPLCKIVCQNQ